MKIRIDINNIWFCNLCNNIFNKEYSLINLIYKNNINNQDNLKKIRRKKITCFNCKKDFCKKCCQDYLLLEKNNNFRCPCCLKIWDIDFLKNNFSFNFITLLRRKFINNRYVCKCINKYCNGKIYKYTNQLICNKCNFIFCRYCFNNIQLQIYPEKREYFDIDNFKVIIKNNSLYNYYSKEQKEKHNNFCNIYHNYYIFECPYCGDDVYYSKYDVENFHYCNKCKKLVSEDEIIDENKEYNSLIIQNRINEEKEKIKKILIKKYKHLKNINKT